MLDELRAMSQEGPEDAHLIVRSEGACQQAERMQLLQPLRVVVIRLSARHDLEVARIHQVDANAGKRPSGVAIVALVVSLAGFALTATNMYLTQLRDPPITLFVGKDMAVYYPRDGGFGMYVPLAFVNRGQRGGAFFRARAVLHRGDEDETFEFEWASFMTRDATTRNYLVAEDAAPIAIPASAAVSKTVWFVWRPDSVPEFELKEGWYSLRILGWTRDGGEADLETARSFRVDKAMADLLLEFRSQSRPTTRFVTFDGSDHENVVVRR